MVKEPLDTPESKALQPSESDGEAASNIVSLTSAMSNQQLQAAVKRMTNQREIIAEFVKSHLKDGTDFGVIDSVSKSGKAFKSKPTLYKPGMEKIFSLFGLVSELERDSETLEMLGDQKNLIAYKCNIYKNGIKIAEGRGAAAVGDLSRDANATIKIAEKRARMDACLSLGFSEYFTQDMEDPDYRQKANNGSSTAAEATAQAPELISENQRRMIFSLLRNTYKIMEADDQRAVLKLNGYDAGNITKSQASELIDKMLKKQFNTDGYAKSVDNVDDNIDMVEEQLDRAVDDMEASNGVSDS